MYKGKIVLVPFPFTDLSNQKVRPCLILHNSPKGEDCIVAFISSTQKERNNFNVPVKPSAKNGLKNLSTIKTNKLATLQKKLVIGEIGVLEDNILSAVDAKLKNIFGL